MNGKRVEHELHHHVRSRLVVVGLFSFVAVTALLPLDHLAESWSTTHAVNSLAASPEVEPDTFHGQISSSSELFAEDFENGFGFWAVEGSSNPGWNLVTSSSPYPKPSGSASGQNNAAWFGDPVTGQYGGNCLPFNPCPIYSGTLTYVGTPIPIPSNASSALLTFQSWELTEKSFNWGCTPGDSGTPYCQVDVRQVWISGTSDSTWQLKWSTQRQPIVEQVWRSVGAIDLSEYKGQSIRIRFGFDTVDGNYNPGDSTKIPAGWYIDDIRLFTSEMTGEIYSEGFEQGLGTSWSLSSLRNNVGWHLVSTSDPYAKTYGGSRAMWFGDPNTGQYGGNCLPISPCPIYSGTLTYVGTPIPIPSNASNAFLTFQSWELTEKSFNWGCTPADNGTPYCQVDVRQVWISGTSDSTWHSVWSTNRDPIVERQWRQVVINLSEYKGQAIRIRFTFDTVDGDYNPGDDSDVNKPAGWFVDDIVLYQIPPTGFLDLPFIYDGTEKTFVTDLQDTDDGGKLSSWFDHVVPNYTKNQGIMLYDGRERRGSATNPTLGCYEGRCYDGHPGFDFIGYLGKPIEPAADGQVVVTVSNCVFGQRQCGGGYGNYVIVHHPTSGYFTRYAHLDTVSVSVSQQVTTGTTLGAMGNTGNVSGPTGVHLHFGVYHDNGNGIWECRSYNTCQDKPVDAFAWKGQTADPWTYDLGYNLWRYDPTLTQVVSGPAGAQLTDKTGQVTVVIPPNAFTETLMFDLTPAPVAASPANVKGFGVPFWVRLPGTINASERVNNTSQITLTLPITLSVRYSLTKTAHLDLSQAALYRWDEAQDVWQELPSAVDPANQVITATSSTLGDFRLQAPLLCPTDQFEPDEAYLRAQEVAFGFPVTRSLNTAQDEDWLWFEAHIGARYTVTTTDWVAGVNPLIELYQGDGVTLITSGSSLVWHAPAEGTYFIHVVPQSGSVVGCNATYKLNVQQELYLYLPLIMTQA